MKKHLSFLLLIAVFTACESRSITTAPEDAEVEAVEPSAPEVAAPTVAPAPPPVKVKDDLNGDGVADFLEVLTTTDDDDGLGFKRRLIVYSGEGADRDAWYTADAIILSTGHGGMVGDPLEGVSIENGAIVIDHFGGSRQKWNYTHRFRWQNGDFQLIGATVVFGAPCEYFVDFDYNLSTGNAIWKKTVEDCETKKDPAVDLVEFKKKGGLVSMDGFYPGDNPIEIPGREGTVYY